MLVAVGLVVAARSAPSVAGSVVADRALGLFTYGVGTSVWDVAMNVEGAAVEQRLGRTIMPRFHAGWSLGTHHRRRRSASLVTALDVPMLVHLTVVGVLALVLLLTVGVPAFLAGRAGARRARRRAAPRGWSRAPWRSG